MIPLEVQVQQVRDLNWLLQPYFVFSLISFIISVPNSATNSIVAREVIRLFFVQRLMDLILPSFSMKISILFTDFAIISKNQFIFFSFFSASEVSASRNTISPCKASSTLSNPLNVRTAIQVIIITTTNHRNQE